MKKVLCMPFLQIPSGHHQVVDAIIDSLTSIDSSLACQKVDILHYSYGKIETLVSSIYLKWIHLFPKTYSWLYTKSVYQNMEKNKNYYLYEILFKRFVHKLVNDMKPNIIICSHALPSYMLNKLKEKNLLDIPVINIYTDFFIHTFWGISHIDAHFVAHNGMKSYLLNKGIDEDKIHVTGIPVHPTLSKKLLKKELTPTSITCTIMGGSLGAGAIMELIPLLQTGKHMTFYVLCGKNQELYNQVSRIKHPRIKPLPYLSSRDDMNDLYNKTDIVITKPGGVTISECLVKRIPIFIYHALPGQEEINVRELTNLGLVIQLPDIKCIQNLEDLLLSKLKQSKKLYQNMEALHNSKSKYTPEEIILNVLERRITNESRQEEANS